MNLASPDRLAENIRVLSVVVAELEFGDVEREIFAADLVIAPHVEAIKEAIIKQSREPIARSKKLSCNNSFDRSKLKKTTAIRGGDNDLDHWVPIGGRPP